MTDTNALRSAIVDSGLKYKALAEIMGLSPYALQMKIDNESEFKASEIDTLANTLGMDMQQRDAIFFLQKKWNLITHNFSKEIAALVLAVQERQGKAVVETTDWAGNVVAEAEKITTDWCGNEVRE